MVWKTASIFTHTSMCWYVFPFQVVWVTVAKKVQSEPWPSGQQHLKSCRKSKRTSGAITGGVSPDKQNGRIPSVKSGEKQILNGGGSTTQKTVEEDEGKVTVDVEKKSSVEHMPSRTSTPGRVARSKHDKLKETSSVTGLSKTKGRTRKRNFASMNHWEHGNAVGPVGDSRRLLGDLWMDKTKRRDPRLEIEIKIGNSDDVRNAYRPDIAQLWNVAEELLGRAGNKFECSICKFRSETKPHVREHIGRTHLYLSEWMCPYCPFQLTRRRPVVSHLRTTHKGVDRYVICCRTYRKNKEVMKTINAGMTELAAYCRLTKGGIRHLANSLLDSDDLLGFGGLLVSFFSIFYTVYVTISFFSECRGWWGRFRGMVVGYKKSVRSPSLINHWGLLIACTPRSTLSV